MLQSLAGAWRLRPEFLDVGRERFAEVMNRPRGKFEFLGNREAPNYKPFPDNPKPNFDIFARSFDPKTKKLSEPQKLSDSPESDVWPVAATDADGHVWVAWQGARENVFRIFQRHQTKDGWSAPEQVSTHKYNCWAPAIAST